MDGIHDLGGKHGFGAVVREGAEEDQPAFHERWEAAVFAMMLAGRMSGAVKNADQFRHAIERIDPVNYLADGYYGRWLGGLETLFVEAGLIDQHAVTKRAVEKGASPSDRIAARPASHPYVVGEGERLPTAQRGEAASPRFKPGDCVRTSTKVVSGHTRLPAYARGKRGVIVDDHGTWVFPDTNAHGKGEDPQHLYTVQFDGRELWGDDSDENIRVSLDLFEPYLSPEEQ